MGLSVRRFRLWNWLAIVAMLFGALAPGLSHAVVGDPSPDSQLTAVCTATGMKYLKADAADRSAPQRQAIAVHADCPSCLFAQFTLPPGERPAFVPSAEPQPLRAGAGAQLHRAAEVRLAAQPRAPPSSS